MLLGYIGKENPATAHILELLNQTSTQAPENYWNDQLQRADEARTAFIKEHSHVMTTKRPAIPVVLERAKHSASQDTKKVVADVLQVIIVPTSHAFVDQILLDGAFFHHKSMPGDFVPIGLRRADPKLYFSLLRDQAKWLHHHRNVQPAATVARGPGHQTVFEIGKKSGSPPHLYRPNS